MIDLTKGGGFDLPEPELEEHWLFAICVAGKRSDITNRKLDRFLRMLPTVGSPFEKIRAAIQEQALGRYLREGKLGPYDRIQRAFEASVAINLRTCMVEDLEEIPGVGPKTSRLFILSTRPNVEYAILDTHILKFLAEHHVGVPRSTPQNGREYRKWERAFLELSKKFDINPRQFDLQQWSSRARSIQRPVAS